MKKILLIIDGLKYKGEALDFAAYIAKQDGSKITGVFLEHMELPESPSVVSVGGQMFVEEITLSEDELAAQEKKFELSIETFSKGCQTRGVDFVIHVDKGNAASKVIRESRFADLVILDPSLSFDGDDTIPSKFTADVLAHAECPVLITPVNFAEIEEVILAYDGSKSSAFAIKQFYAQLPSLGKTNVVVLHIKEDGHKSHKLNSHFKEWLDLHVSSVDYLELSGDPRDQLYDYLRELTEHNNKLLVTGSFGRTALSMFFNPSTVGLVLKSIDIPIYIAHR